MVPSYEDCFLKLSIFSTNHWASVSYKINLIILYQNCKQLRWNNKILNFKRRSCFSSPNSVLLETYRAITCQIFSDQLIRQFVMDGFMNNNVTAQDNSPYSVLRKVLGISSNDDDDNVPAEVSFLYMVPKHCRPRKYEAHLWLNLSWGLPYFSHRIDFGRSYHGLSILLRTTGWEYHLFLEFPQNLWYLAPHPDSSDSVIFDTPPQIFICPTHGWVLGKWFGVAGFINLLKMCSHNVKKPENSFPIILNYSGLHEALLNQLLPTGCWELLILSGQWRALLECKLHHFTVKYRLLCWCPRKT